MDGIVFPFLRLPVELQVGTMEHLSNYSDLKALCLVSKHVSNIATPWLYSNVDLKKEEYQDEWLIEQRIKSLLIEPANLLFVRILKTPPFGKELTQLMDQVLPLLKKDFLLEFSFSIESTRCFPTPLQMQLLWARQKKPAEPQTLLPHGPPHLSKLLKFVRSRSALLKSFTKLDISDRTDRSSMINHAIMC